MVASYRSAGQVYAMLGNESLWEVACRCHAALSQSGVPYAICGGVAVCLRGYQRNTTDLDILVRREDADTIRESLLQAGFVRSSENSEFVSSTGIAIQCLVSGDRAGPGSEVRFPDPAEDLVVET